MTKNQRARAWAVCLGVVAGAIADRIAVFMQQANTTSELSAGVLAATLVGGVLTGLLLGFSENE